MLKNFVFKAEAGKVFSALAARMGLFVTVILFAGLVHAQQPPLTFVYEPDAWDVGDTVSIEFVYGSAQNPVSPANEFHLIHDYSGLEYVIDQESVFTVDTTASWICGDCTVSTWVDHEQQRIHVWISRDDEVGGYGTVFVLRGIITIIDDLHRKAKPALLNGDRSKGENFLVNISDQKIFILQPGTLVLEVAIIDIATGKNIFSRKYWDEYAKIDITNFSAGIYTLVARSEAKFISRKFIVR